jgi:Cu(I)/Ag(I) efflux system membrane fusion protein
MNEFFKSVLPSDKKQQYIFIGLIVAAFVVGWMMNSDESAQQVAKEISQATTWTCSMHPQIQQPEPGQCPICGMDLIPVQRDDTAETEYRQIALSPRARKLASIQVAPVERKFVGTEIRMVGKIDYDETQLSSITAWVPGRIDRMFVDYTGISVRKGEHMVEMYSPELVSTQQELIQTKKSAEQTLFKNNINSIRERLRLWGLTARQIQEIEDSEKVTERVTITAPMSGIVIQRDGLEGMYVNTGTRLYTIADLNRVWLILEAYETEIQWLRYGQDVSFTTQAYPGTEFSGKIAFIDPVLNEKSRTIKVRVNVKNDNSKLKPGMFVSARVNSRIAAGGKVMDPDLSGKWISPMHPEIVKDGPGSCDVCGMALVRAESLGYISAADLRKDASIVIPASAPLITGKRAVVYVQVQGKEGVFEGREVTLGPRAGDYYIVEKGLKEGELVVTNGNFKIDSAIQIQAGPSMMNPQGGAVKTGHQHGDPVDRNRSIKSEPDPISAAFIAQLDNVYDRYFQIQEALSHDNHEAAVRIADEIIESLKNVDMKLLEGEKHDRWMTIAGDIKLSAQRMASSETIKQARTGFKGLSDIIILLAGQFGSSGKQPVLLYRCPMAFGNSGADWLQNKEGTENPYFGSAMFRCGSQEKDLTHGGDRNTGDHQHE